MSDEIGTEAWARQAARPYVNRYTKEPHNPAHCCASVLESGMFNRSHQCTKKPKAFYGALGYCGAHDPVAAKKRSDEKSAARTAAWKAQSVASDRAKLIASLHVEAVSALVLIADGHDDPRGLAADILARFPK